MALADVNAAVVDAAVDAAADAWLEHAFGDLHWEQVALRRKPALAKQWPVKYDRPHGAERLST